MKTCCLAFTDKGMELGERLTEEFGAYADRCNEPMKLGEWTKKAFEEADNIIFIGACGIAVRAIAPYIVSKVTDPAVIVIDECGDYVISLLSGHLGGANDLARRIASFIGAVPVITTATDRNDVFAVDEWSKRQNAIVLDPHKIKLVSSKILAGDEVTVKSGFDLEGDLPDHIRLASCGESTDEEHDIEFGVLETETAPLHIVPQIVHLGVGCRKDTPEAAIETAFAAFKRETGLIERSVVKCASIDIKAAEPGLREFCEFHGWRFDTFTAEELGRAEGDFDSSEFVKKTTGVDNVCERAAVTSSGGKLLLKKFAHEGVTFAAAAAPYHPDWRWKDE
ncbi:MAG: cobalt-precorrin 5A hydrolase [Eubacterium sp.]|nr:cobalt-precorrin 5A hydrolase [Eubacterium sp.]